MWYKYQPQCLTWKVFTSESCQSDRLERVNIPIIHTTNKIATGSLLNDNFTGPDES